VTLEPRGHCEELAQMKTPLAPDEKQLTAWILGIGIRLVAVRLLFDAMKQTVAVCPCQRCNDDP
jgi:hypothetical protein